ncbi:hypothetical protein A3I48_01145 [Candidatus Daviesbacteria bacterium RIFCSPLOWO2_02_FULL_36_7]|uniref:Uncharacterized protein n=1 Tax=Candidatus Daviesbacteria bacterium RIFCSPLOWO2_02_FULL_36_7 TaxID=1797792 RepID=A0A1F5MHJ7_9BACT|nr:MAG: hypothetical protein A3I48_01145 [Candidatus Daviesbacteria bacterium RIFCSPLOWO2_02_FULL_36_7]
MLILKKLILAPFFAVIFALLIYQLTSFLKSYDFVFSLSLNTFTSLLILSALICLSSFLFVLFVTLSQDLKITLPSSLLFVLVPIVFLDTSLALVLAVAIFVSLLLASLNLDSTLKSYLTFQPGSLLGPAVRHLSGFLILSFCVVYFLSSSKIVAQNGFQIPDSLIDTALKFSMPATPGNQLEQVQASLPQITPEQLDLLKKNPDLLRQSGLDPKILDSLSNPQKSAQSPANLTNDLIKQTVKDQIQTILKPYLSFIPAILAILLFLTLQSLTSILNLLIYPLLSAAFFLLEKSGFVRYEIEQRPVKKMVV